MCRFLSISVTHYTLSFTLATMFKGNLIIQPPSCVNIHLRIFEQLPVGPEEELQSLVSTFEGEGPREKDEY